MKLQASYSTQIGYAGVIEELHQDGGRQSSLYDRIQPSRRKPSLKSAAWPPCPAALGLATHLVILGRFEQFVGSFLKQRRVRAVDELGGHGTSWHVGKHEAEAKLFVLLVDILEFGDGDAALPQSDAHAPLQTTRGWRLLRGSRFLPGGGRDSGVRISRY